MIEIIGTFPDRVVGLIAKGQVTKQDYERILIPRIEAALQRHKKIRLYYELGLQFSGIDSGAAWEDLKIGVEHLGSWERMAVVTDVDWIKHMINAFRFLIPGDLRLFPTAQTLEARAWIVEGAAA
ncbi:MAG TPA: STAS/SEC14 domain-containing protein [Bryobacteraceae bacterium]|nr:STAS/SEC14 domain-containing protein [Bryobacteraceae bacterium]